MNVGDVVWLEEWKYYKTETAVCEILQRSKQAHYHFDASTQLIGENMTTKQLLVFGEKTFKISIPADAKVTFGPWSPPTGKQGYGDREALKGTLRIYGKTKDNIIACFAGVSGFRDLSMQYAEEVAKEEGATIWKDDEKGYMREDKVSRTKAWITDPMKIKQLDAPKKGKKGKADDDGEVAF